MHTYIHTYNYIGGNPRQVRRTPLWVENTYGEGPSCFWCHVQIASKYNDILPEWDEDQQMQLEDSVTDDYTKSSRLACMITLDKRHDGMVVFVPDAPPIDII